MSKVLHYTVKWSAEDKAYIATVDEYPSLSWVDEDSVVALRRLQALIQNEGLIPMADDEYPDEPYEEEKPMSVSKLSALVATVMAVMAIPFLFLGNPLGPILCGISLSCWFISGIWYLTVVKN